MGAPDAIPDLQYQKPDGSLLSRLEMETQMRKLWPKVHWLRRHANVFYDLQKQHAYGMKEAVLRHWLLDEMVRRGQIIGDQVGVSLTNYEDENEQRQFIQRLSAMIQAGQAQTPKEGEGVDMSNLPQQPPPPVTPNGQAAQPQFAPPPPPMGAAPQGYAPPSGPPGFAPPPPPYGAPPGMAPAAPPAPPQGFAPPAAPPGFAPAPAPQGFAPAAPPMPPGMAGGAPPMPPGYAPPAGPPSAPPGPPAAASGGRGRGKKADGPAAPPPPAAPVPPMTPQAPQQAAMPQMAFPSFPGAPQAPAPQQGAPQATVDLGSVIAKIDALAGLVTQQAQIIASLQKQITVLSMGAALTLRIAYQKQGAADMESILKEIGVQFPQ